MSEQLFLRDLVCFNFYRGWRGISEYYRAFLPSNVSAPQSYVLEVCDESSGITVGKIAEALEIDLPAISSLLRRMESSGMIRREVLPENRRHTLVFLTPYGAEIRAQVRSSMVQADRELGKLISQQEVLQLICIVDKIRDVINTR
jgi:DNA-binding MarR family transcriptional regulator